VGGTDDYESKLSLMPLVFGTLKGTLYALVFAVPVAVMAAIYTAHFMAPSVKRVVKPVMEIMASLPSVVLGFFGALYLAPRMEDKVPALLCMAVLIPGLAALIAWFWTTRPAAWRNKFRRGVEYIVMTPVILLCAWFCWEYLGYWLEQPLISLCRGAKSLLDQLPRSQEIA
jgi:phosphate transport system permease protein